jgi:hypothetical protein
MSRALAVLLVLTAAVAAPAGAAPAETIGTVASVDYRVVVTARRSSGGSAPTARVDATTYRWSHGGWQRLGTRRLAGTFFWKVVSSPHAVCELAIATAGGRAKPQATVQLLISPSLGCGRVYRMNLA